VVDTHVEEVVVVVVVCAYSINWRALFEGDEDHVRETSGSGPVGGWGDTTTTTTTTTIHTHQSRERKGRGGREGEEG